MLRELIESKYESEDVLFLELNSTRNHQECWTRERIFQELKSLDSLRRKCEGRVVSVAFSRLESRVQGLLYLILLEGSARSLMLRASSEVPESGEEIVEGLFLLPDEKRDFTRTQWLVPTSGSTGAEKFIPHTFSSLMSSSRKTRSGWEYRWGLLYEPFRFAGLQVLCTTLINGASLAMASARTTLRDTLRFFSEMRVTALSATPSLWRMIAIDGCSTTLPLQQITIGGEIVDQVILDALSCMFPQARITHIYASTEVGVGFSVHDKREGFPSSYLDRQFLGKKIVILDGELCFESANKDDQVLPRANDLVHTGDMVDLKGDRYIFLGRNDTMINVGGRKTYPERVERILRQSDLVLDVRVYPRRSSLLGAFLAADVVFSANFHEENIPPQKVIRNICQGKVEEFEIPALVNRVETIDIGKHGKVQRKPSA